MSHNDFTSSAGMGMPSGLASRRGGQGIKPLSLGAQKLGDMQDTGVSTPRTARSQLLDRLRTAPKSATASTFANPDTPSHQYGGRPNGASSYYANSGNNPYYGQPKTSLPRMATQQQGAYNNNNMTGMSGGGHHNYTPEQILAPPELHLDDQIQDQMDPNMYAQLLNANMYLAQQKQQLQQQLLNVQAQAQRFAAMNLSGQQAVQQQMALQTLFQQQQHIQAMQQSINAVPAVQVPVQQNLFTYTEPNTGITYLVDATTAQYHNMQQSNYQDNVPGTPQGAPYHHSSQSMPRVQVSPPPENSAPVQRTISPPKRQEMVVDPTPLPPPSANAFRRGHKKSSSLANGMKGLTIASDDGSKSATGPKTASLPLTPMSNGSYGPGQGRAGEHPVRQPTGPPPMEKLKAKPTTKHEGSLNFATRARREAVRELKKAGEERRHGSSCGSVSPVSEGPEELGTPLTDNESDSGRSGSGSLSGDAEPSLASSRTSASGGWGAIGSERPGSRQKSRRSVDSQASIEGDNSFASVFKHGSQRQPKVEGQNGERKASRLVLLSADKRKSGVPGA
ncbi:hypothetical protein F4808DRAFT_465010 [Astrocystis sublimbata]|nr:hypothetical protein F4808DRAFT_465010 [Astrocystis sublimbata]